MIRYFKTVLETLQVLAEAAAGINEVLARRMESVQDGEQLERRVRKLELDREEWEANVEGMLLKAEGKFNAARAAEERTRSMVKANGREDEAAGEGDEEGLDPFLHYAEQLQRGDAEGGEEGGVPAVRPAVASPRERGKAAARQLKFGY